VFNKRLDKIKILKEELSKENCELKINFLSNGTIIDDYKINEIKNNRL